MDSRWNRHFLVGGPRFAVCLIGLMVGVAGFATAATGPGTGTQGVPASPVTITLHDIRGPFEIRSLGDVLRLASLVLLIVGLMALTWWLWRRRKPKAEQVRLVPPDERARERLTEAMALIQQPERFCTVVSEILRVYLEERFGLRAPERTTEEFLSELARSAALDARHKSLLAEFLTQCDLAKFAQANPGRLELESLHASGLRLVDETSPRLAEPPLLAPPPLPASRP